jgi:hypothetical protein
MKKTVIGFLLFGILLTALQAQLALIKPGTGDSWKLGTSQSIIWTFSVPASTLVKLVLFQNGVKVGNIAQNIAVSAVSLSWNVGSFEGGTAPTGSGFRIRIISMDGQFQHMGSDFSIVPNISIIPPGPLPLSGSLKLGAPVGGESWMLNNQEKITWSSSDISGNIRLVLLKNGNKVGNIKENIPLFPNAFPWTVGQYETNFWIPDSMIAPGYTIRIETMDGLYKDECKGSFSIVQPSLQVKPIDRNRKGMVPVDKSILKLAPPDFTVLNAWNANGFLKIKIRNLGMSWQGKLRVNYEIYHPKHGFYWMKWMFLDNFSLGKSQEADVQVADMEWQPGDTSYKVELNVELPPEAGESNTQNNGWEGTVNK